MDRLWETAATNLKKMDGYTVQCWPDSRFITSWHSNKMRVASMTSALLVLLVVLQQLSARDEGRLATKHRQVPVQVEHENGQRFNNSNTKPQRLLHTCIDVIRGSECGPKWPKKPCATCCVLESYKGIYKENTISNLCEKCCKILFHSATCRSFPKRRPCRNCCVNLINSLACRLVGGAKCRYCCSTTLRNSAYCKNPTRHFQKACNTRKSYSGD